MVQMDGDPSTDEAIALAKKARRREIQRRSDAKRNIKADPEYIRKNRERARAWLAKPENRERAKQNRNAPEYQARLKAQRKLPENAEKRREHVRRTRADPEYAARERLSAASEQTRARVREWQAARIKSNPQFRIARTLRARLQGVMKGTATASGVRDLGCTLPELIAHLEARFEPWMSWTNYGNKVGDWWSVDHIRPLASFDLTDPEQQRAAVHYTNLQPMRHTDNIKKGGRWA